jgi:drug/metabolite transporter (DMT)-like permease
LTDAASNPTPPPKPRGWALVAAGLLLLALALVVLYTGRGAFLSPLALVVVAAIGLAALLLQLRLRKDSDTKIHAPLWLNVLGLIFAISAVIIDFLHQNANIMLVAALAAVVCFAVSGMSVLRSMRTRNR